MEGWLWDIEADGLYLLSKKVWYMRFKSLDGSKTMYLHPFRQPKEYVTEKILEWINSFNDGVIVAGHNILGYDAWMLWKFFGIKPVVGKGGKDYFGGKQVQFVDSLILSQYLQPDLMKHSLEYLARGSEDEKMDYRAKLVEAGVMIGNEPKGHEFSFYHDIMPSYCDDDVDANIGVLKKLWKQAKEMYGDSWIHPSFKQMQKDYFLYSAQAYTGVKFNIEKAKALTAHIETEMARIKEEVDPLLPPRPLKTAEQAYYKIPAKPFKRSGELSGVMEKWLEKHNAKLEDGYIYAYGLKTKLVANEVLPVKLPMEIDDNVELKQYFIDSGWKPSEDYWNFKKGPDGKPVRDERGKLIATTPKIQHAGNLCPNLLKLDGEIPAKVVKFLSLRNRLGVVTGWLSNPRLEFDGRISAEISGYTPTFRVRHRTVVNCPKADVKVLLGSEMRDLFTVDKGFWYCGADQSALENRTLAAYTIKYDGGKFADMVLNGDSHSFNSFAFFPNLREKFDINDPTNKDNPDFKPWRNKSKTGSYLLAYGGGVGKLASSLGLSKTEAQIAYDNYWIANYGLGQFKDKVEQYFSTVGKNKYVPAWDGRLLSVRGKNVLVNCLGQSLGAIAMSITACFMDAKLGEMYIDKLGRPYYLYKGKMVKRISLVHDEYSWEVEGGIQDDVAKLMVDCMVEAGKYLKLPLELAGEAKISFEGSWRDVH
jgi:hypothetical protein